MRRCRPGHVGTQRLFLGFVSNTVHSKLISFLSEKTCLAHETSSTSIIIQITHNNNKHTAIISWFLHNVSIHLIYLQINCYEVSKRYSEVQVIYLPVPYSQNVSHRLRATVLPLWSWKGWVYGQPR